MTRGNEATQAWDREQLVNADRARRAILTVCRMADDATDAASLLDMLGLEPRADVRSDVKHCVELQASSGSF